MEPAKRKRVTRVGSGAFSIYLPKKWIDGWLPEQQERREVELRFISQSLLVTPAILDKTYRATVPVDQGSVCMRLLSAYVRGNHRVALAPPDGKRFDNDCVTAARDFLRHLDERLVAHAAGDSIGFSLDPGLPPPASTGDDMLHVLGAKVREVLALAADAVRMYGHDPDRTLHALHLLRTIHHEDVERLFHQILRMVTSLEIPMRSVSEYQFLGLAAAEMHQISGNALKMARTILEAYGLTPEDLGFPRAHLLGRMERPPPVQGVALELVRGYREPFERTQALHQQLLDAFQARDIAALMALVDEAPRVQDRLQERTFQVVAEQWGRSIEPEDALAAHTASKIASPLANILDSMRMIAHHAVALLAAEKEGDGPEAP